MKLSLCVAWLILDCLPLWNESPRCTFCALEDFEGDYDNSIPPQQASVIDNYKFIIEDMDNAISYLPKFEEYSDDDKGRAHKAAAVAYKAKVYAYWATWDETQWNNVIAMVNSLETDYGRGLADTFAEVFSFGVYGFLEIRNIFGLFLPMVALQAAVLNSPE